MWTGHRDERTIAEASTGRELSTGGARVDDYRMTGARAVDATAARGGFAADAGVHPHPFCPAIALVMGTDQEAVAVAGSGRVCAGVGAMSACEQDSEHDHSGAEGEVEPVVGGVERNEVGGFVVIEYQPENP